jgi:TRAP-type C4-dicarboxylate transport system permease large subunit
VNFNEVIKPLLPFYLCCLITLIVVTFVPEFSLFFVNLVK